MQGPIRSHLDSSSDHSPERPEQDGSPSSDKTSPRGQRRILRASSDETNRHKRYGRNTGSQISSRVASAGGYDLDHNPDTSAGPPSPGSPLSRPRSESHHVTLKRHKKGRRASVIPVDKQREMEWKDKQVLFCELERLRHCYWLELPVLGPEDLQDL